MINYGWDTELDLGTTGDYFVDAATGSDGNAGTSLGAPKSTIMAAMNAAPAGSVIRVRAGTYRELVVMKSGVSDADRTELLAYGTERPIITAAQTLTGWTACGVGDLATVGSNYASIYKTTIATSAIASGTGLCLNLHENGEKLFHCMAGWTGLGHGDKFYHESNSDWNNADSVETNEAGDITGYVSASITSAYTEAQVINGTLYGHTDPNVNFMSAITSVVGSTIVLADQTQEYETNSNKDTFMIVNVLPAMEQGEWGYSDNGDGTLTVYCWPNSAANLTAGIEYSARIHCINTSSKNHITVKGFDCRQSAGDDSDRDGLAITNYDLTVNSNVTIEHCKVSKVFSTLSGSRHGARFVSVNNLRFRNNIIEDVQGCFGFFVSAQVKSPLADTVFSEGLDCQFNYVHRSTNSGMHFYTLLDAVVAFNHMEYCGLAAHANKINFYEQCHSILIWGNTFTNCGGYAAYQEASALFWMFNHFIGDQEDWTYVSARVFQDQNNNTAPPITYIGDAQDSYFVNNSCIPPTAAYDPANIAIENGLTIGSTLSANIDVQWHVWNNLYHGHVVNSYGPTLSWESNWNTARDGNYTTGNTSTTMDDVYTNPAGGDFSIKNGSAISTTAGRSISDLIENILKPRFDDRFDGWDMDVDGETFSAATPPIAARIGTGDIYVPPPAPWALTSGVTMVVTVPA